MKQLLVVMTLFTCAYFSFGFSASRNGNASTSTINLRSQILRWKNSSWVNPWVKTKPLNTNNCVTVTDVFSTRVATKCSINFYGVPIPVGAERVMWHDIPPGTMVTVEFDVPTDPSMFQGCYVRDETTGQYLYGSEEPPAYYQWLTVAGHVYYVYFWY